MSAYDSLQAELTASPRTWLITGVGGFIGSNLLERLLKLGQKVKGLDNFATGQRANLDQVQSLVTGAQWGRFEFIEAGITDQSACRNACQGVDFVLHQAALGSVPRSIEEPAMTHEANVTGFLNVLLAARDARVRRLVYASSSAVYGDDAHLPKMEERIGKPLSPYAATKAMNEVYADVFARTYEFESIGLRYFNVFGPRQDPEGAYAAVIPKWTSALLKGEPVQMNGDGETSRDFCYIDNVVQANLLAAATTRHDAVNQVYNIALGERTTLNQLFHEIRQRLLPHKPGLQDQAPVYRDFRAGDVRHSLADITKARRLLGYSPAFRLADGLALALEWYRLNL